MSNKYGLVLVVLLLVALTACGPSEKEIALSDEVAQLTEAKHGLESQLAEKQAELEAIQATPAGMLCIADMFIDSDRVQDRAMLEKAIELYDKVVTNHPNSEHVKEAKRMIGVIEEVRRDKPVSNEVGQRQWDQFRANPSKYIGTEVCWRLRLWFNSYEDPLCNFRLRRSINARDIFVTSPGNLTYKAAVLAGRLPRLIDDDVFTVRGTFIGITDDGEVVLEANKVVN